MLFCVASSRRSAPVSAPNTVAASATVRQIGPTVSWVWEIGTTPARLVRPTVGLIPTTPLTEDVRVDALPSTPAPAAAWARRAEIGPLAEIGLAQDDGARVAEPLRHGGVLVWPRTRQAQRPGRRHHVRGVDVVFEHDRDAMQWAAHVAGPTLLVEPPCDFPRVLVHFEDRPKGGTLLVQTRNPIQVELDQVGSSEVAALHGRLQIGDCRLHYRVVVSTMAAVLVVTCPRRLR